MSPAYQMALKIIKHIIKTIISSITLKDCLYALQQD